MLLPSSATPHKRRGKESCLRWPYHAAATAFFVLPHNLLVARVVVVLRAPVPAAVLRPRGKAAAVNAGAKRVCRAIQPIRLCVSIKDGDRGSESNCEKDSHKME